MLSGPWVCCAFLSHKVIAVICQPDGAETILDDDSCYRAAATLLSVASVRNRT